MPVCLHAGGDVGRDLFSMVHHPLLARSLSDEREFYKYITSSMFHFRGVVELN